MSKFINIEDIPPCPLCGPEDSEIEVVEEVCKYFTLVRNPDGSLGYEFDEIAEDGEPRIIRYGCCGEDLPRDIERAIAKELGIFWPNGFWNFHDRVTHEDAEG